jgi:glutamate N-acetyltransferase / amino-acid N-acetyltransferase
MNKKTSVSAPKGFLFSTIEAAIKKPGRKDLAIIFSQAEANIAGAFTTNRVKAAPVILDMKRIKSGRGQAIVVNSGNANACTGKKGLRDATEMAGSVSKGLHIKPSLVYVSSTGVIGSTMPMDRIRPAIAELLSGVGRSSFEDVAAAIMTTDTFPKIVKQRVRVGNQTGTIAGICKGAGMICPNMATMLCFILTDIAVDQKTLDRTLREVVKKSFNRLTIDGDMSTNDTVLIMANGILGNPPVSEKTETYPLFRKALSELTVELAKMIARDGEGATKYIEVEIKGAKKEADAEKAALAVANSNLVKTAICGNDANWGRIMGALGYSGVFFKEKLVDIFFGKVKIVCKGLASGKDKEAGEVLKGKEIKIVIDLHVGKASAKVFTCDLTEEYIRINADYRT